VNQQEISILTLIYNDLASRIEENKLTFENFLNFFDLTGLWGVKLFEQFDEDQMGLITFEEFLYGICNFVII
jgi:Ca2+-binding EF-hand superfamily protein